MVKRERGEGGDDAYRISARLVHNLILAVFGSILTYGGYMAIWAINDASWKAALDERLTNMAFRISALEQSTAVGVLPIARERINQLDQRVRDLERKESRQP